MATKSIAELKASKQAVKVTLSPWFGTSPDEVKYDKEKQPDDVEFESFLNQRIVVLGFSMRQSDKEKYEHGEDYAVMLVSPEESDEIFVVATGATVIVKKLKDAAENKLLPIVGKLIRKKGGKFSYFDLIPE